MDVTFQFIALVPIVLGLVAVVKKVGMTSRFAPLLSVVLGVAGALLIGDVSKASIVQGIIAGLSASGLWSGAKASFFS